MATLMKIVDSLVEILCHRNEVVGQGGSYERDRSDRNTGVDQIGHIYLQNIAVLLPQGLGIILALGLS